MFLCARGWARCLGVADAAGAGRAASGPSRGRSSPGCSRVAWRAAGLAATAWRRARCLSRLRDVAAGGPAVVAAGPSPGPVGVSRAWSGCAVAPGWRQAPGGPGFALAAAGLGIRSLQDLIFSTPTSQLATLQWDCAAGTHFQPSSIMLHMFRERKRAYCSTRCLEG